MGTAMTHMTLPLWVYTGLGAMGIALCCLGYLSTQHITATPVQTPATEIPPSLFEVLHHEHDDITSSGNTVTLVTTDVVSTLRVLQKSRIPLTRCSIIAGTQTYTMTMEAQP